MNVYIEYAIAENFIIDFFLLSAAFTLTGKRDKKAKRVIAAACGAAAA